jgi:putative ABC transport system permease protein
MNIDQVLVVERPGISSENDSISNHAVDVFRAELRKEPTVVATSTSLTVPGKQREYKGALKRMGAPDSELVTMRVNSMDYDFLEVFGMRLVAGRKFGPEFSSDPDTSVIITEAGTRLLGFTKPEDAINQTLTIAAFQWNPIIVGVVNDYHQVSLKEQLDPTIFYCTTHNGEFYSMRITTNDMQRTINHIEKSWATAFPGNPFQYFFLDDYFNQQYANEQRFGRLAAAFAILAIIVGCLGLFGLSGYMIAQRTKEIGIRKILGASVSGIIGLLSKDILKLILLAILLAAPLGWWAMTQWLQAFPYRINIGWQVFVLAGVISLVVGFITVSLQSVKAAVVNPVASLRSE